MQLNALQKVKNDFYPLNAIRIHPKFFMKIGHVLTNTDMVIERPENAVLRYITHAALSHILSSSLILIFHVI
jgi:hypothetical protein